MELDRSELEPLLERIGWRKSTLARKLGCSEKTIRQMVNGDRAIPQSVARYLWKLDRCHEKNPAPDDWRIREDLAPDGWGGEYSDAA
jgi:DNA-binding XRE family transcriptional regulator